jgi:predicted O-methyltransferase YrrM
MKKTSEIQGWFGDYQQSVYDFLIDKTPETGTFVEIGAWLGKSSSYLVDNSGNRNIIIIDSWEGSPNERATNHRLATETDIYEIFKENMGDRKYQSIRGLSTEVANQFEDESLDTVFIDATHTYEAVKEDIKVWYPKVKKGGILAGDDYVTAWPGVIKAVKEVLPQHDEMLGRWIHYKK